MAQSRKEKAVTANEEKAPDTTAEKDQENLMPSQTGNISLSAKNLGVLIASILLAMGGTTAITRAIDAPVKADAAQYTEIINLLNAHKEKQAESTALLLQRMTAVETKIQILTEQRRR